MARFFKFTADMAEFLREHLTLSEWKLWSYFATLDPFGKSYIELPPLVTILMECGISERTFYRAIAKFKELELFDFQYDKAYIRNLNGSDMNGSETVTGGSEDDTDGSETVSDGSVSIYKEFKNLSDFPEARESEQPEGPDNPGNPGNVAIASGVITEISQVSTVQTISPGDDKFSEARTGKTVQQRAFNWLPDGPWVIDGKLDPNFRDWLAGKWLAEYGKDIHTQRANVLSHFKKDPANLPIRWEQYQGEYLDRFTNTQILLDNGVEIKPEYQETLIANQRAITQSLPQELNPLALAPIPQETPKAIAPVTQESPALVPIPENGENWQAYKIFQAPKPVEEPITPEQWEATKAKLAALTGKFNFGKGSPRENSPSKGVTESTQEAIANEVKAKKQAYLDELNRWIADPLLRDEAVKQAKISDCYKCLFDENGIPYQVIYCEEF